MTNLYLPFYFEWINFISPLPDEEYGRLTRAVFDYAVGHKRKKPTFSPDAEMAYKFITAAINRSELKRHGTSQKNDVKKKKEIKTFKRVERSSDESQKEASTDAPCVSEKSEPQNSRASAKNEPQNNGKSLQEGRKKAPTRDEVRNFFNSRGFKSNPDEFFNFYESNGWMVGQNPMQNWHSSAENWELRAEREKSAAKPESERPRYGDYDVHEAFALALERSYGTPDEDEDEEKLE